MHVCIGQMGLCALAGGFVTHPRDVYIYTHPHSAAPLQYMHSGVRSWGTERLYMHAYVRITI